MIDLNIVVGIIGVILLPIVEMCISAYYNGDNLDREYFRNRIFIALVMTIEAIVMVSSLFFAWYMEVIENDLILYWILILYGVIIILTEWILLDRFLYSFIYIILLDLVNEHISILSLEKKASEEYRFFKDGKEIKDNERANYFYEGCYSRKKKNVLLANEVDDDKKIIHVLKLEDLKGKSTDLTDALNLLFLGLYNSKKQ